MQSEQKGYQGKVTSLDSAIWNFIFIENINVELSQHPQSLHQYTNETNASLIYCQLMNSVGETITLHYCHIIDYGTGKQFLSSHVIAYFYY
jgi:hypothetical protein